MTYIDCFSFLCTCMHEYIRVYVGVCLTIHIKIERITNKLPHILRRHGKNKERIISK